MIRADSDTNDERYADFLGLVSSSVSGMFVLVIHDQCARARTRE